MGRVTTLTPTMKYNGMANRPICGDVGYLATRVVSTVIKGFAPSSLDITRTIMLSEGMDRKKDFGA